LAANRVPILCYHQVFSDDDPEMPDVAPGAFCAHVTRTRFERHLQCLSEMGCNLVTHTELVRWLVADDPLPEHPVLIDFDDNRLTVFESAYPVLKALHWPATVFVISSLAGRTGPFAQAPFPAMGWRELELLADAGWLIGAHTQTHAWLDYVYDEPDGPERVEAELAGCRLEIRDHLGLTAEHFAYPAGRSRPEVEAIVARHYTSARLWNPGAPFIPEKNFVHPVDPIRLAAETTAEDAHPAKPWHWDPKRPFVYNTKQTHRYRLEANNISEMTDDSTFRRLLEEAIG